MRTLLGLMLVGLIPFSHGDQKLNVDEKELVRQTDADDFNALTYDSPTHKQAICGYYNSRHLKSSDIKEKQAEYAPVESDEIKEREEEGGKKRIKNNKFSIGLRHDF